MMTPTSQCIGRDPLCWRCGPTTSKTRSEGRPCTIGVVRQKIIYPRWIADRKTSAIGVFGGWCVARHVLRRTLERDQMISAVRWLSSTFRFYSGRGALRCPCSNLALCFIRGL